MALSRGLAKYNNHKMERLSELFLKPTKYDLLFVGSSRTHTGIYPKVVDSICRLNSYNAGVEGGNLLEFRITLAAYLNTHPLPQYVVLTIDLNSFDLKRKFFNYSQYYPFVKNKVIEQSLNENGHNTAAIKILPFLILTGYDDYTKSNAIKGLTGHVEIPPGDFQYKGYLSNSENQLTEIEEKVSPKTYQITAEGVESLEQIIRLCRQKNIKLIFAYAPEYKFGLQHQTLNPEQILNLIRETASKNEIPYFRDDSLDLCNNPALFANTGHLNKQGAYDYSIILAHEINEVRDGR
ncbi:MAG: hypothetical protein ABJA57_02385 [Ginsengibacter sp.]